MRINKLSVISAIRNKFAIGQQHSAGFSNQQNAARKTTASRGAEANDDVAYVGLNDSDSDVDIQMLQYSLEYEAYKDMGDSDRERNKK